jgi:uncharacterized membrane protein YfcA
MGSWSTIAAADFPAQLDESEIETRGVRQAFGWGAQCLWLLCGLIWLFVYIVRDVREAAMSVSFIAIGVTFFSVIAWFYERKRRRQQIVLFPSGEIIGCYHGGKFQYSFPYEHLKPVRKDFFESALLVIKVIIPLGAVAAALVFGIIYSFVNETQKLRVEDEILMIYALFFTLFGLYAVVRSIFVLRHYWIPDGKGKAQSLYMERRELIKLTSNGAPLLR